jgi:type II secretory pathway component PulF
MQFQATCSKGNKKLTLSVNANDIDDARDILHKQGYSIIEIKEFSGASTQE